MLKFYDFSMNWVLLPMNDLKLEIIKCNLIKRGGVKSENLKLLKFEIK